MVGEKGETNEITISLGFCWVLDQIGRKRWIESDGGNMAKGTP